MTLLEALNLGIVQGLTEFLPVSSSAHLVFVPALMRIPPNVAFDVVLHAGTLLAVTGYFWKDILTLIKAFFASLADIPAKKFGRGLKEDQFKRLAWLIIAASIPAAMFGFLFKKFIESLFTSVPAVALLLVGTGVLLWIAEKARRHDKTIRDISLRDSLVIGLAQAVAMAPGISRSGATISAGFFCGLQRETAARFSFLLSIPAILGATVLHITDISSGFHLSAGVFLA
ncbi:MAG: undecaprenyl-diphosphate phosphatase, partial [Candidatus Aminicenantes bacterium]|nr:undecaprenyl-diphosphate phosphatase [Candidatus Aminicenantes bacterium]